MRASAPPPVRKPRVLLADDHALFRAGLHLLLQNVANVLIVGEASDGREVLRLLKTVRPDIVIMDLAMPRLNGLEATVRMRREFPQTRVLILSMYATSDYVVQALRAGARGYLLKDSAPTELGLAVQAVARGEMYLSAAVSETVITDYLYRLKSDRKETDRNTGVLLTPRQRELLQLIAEGRTSKEIAALLQLSTNTIETHRRRLMARLEVRDIAGLVRAAFRLGVISPDR
ncbi:MAG: response regulator [Candidatus Binatia bacterium]